MTGPRAALALTPLAARAFLQLYGPIPRPPVLPRTVIRPPASTRAGGRCSFAIAPSMRRYPGGATRLRLLQAGAPPIPPPPPPPLPASAGRGSRAERARGHG